MVGAGDLNARPPAPKTLDPLICASIDSTTCRLCVLGLVETIATIWTANLQFGLPNHRQNQPEVLLEVPIAKYNQRGRAPAVAAVGRSVVERLADPSYNRDFGQVPGHFPESRFHGQWHRLRVARDTTGALNGALRTSVNTARQGGSYFNLRAFRDSFRMAKINRSKSAWTQVSA